MHVEKYLYVTILLCRVNRMKGISHVFGDGFPVKFSVNGVYFPYE